MNQSIEEGVTKSIFQKASRFVNRSTYVLKRLGTARLSKKRTSLRFSCSAPGGESSAAALRVWNSLFHSATQVASRPWGARRRSRSWVRNWTLDHRNMRQGSNAPRLPPTEKGAAGKRRRPHRWMPPASPAASQQSETTCFGYQPSVACEANAPFPATPERRARETRRRTACCDAGKRVRASSSQAARARPRPRGPAVSSSRESRFAASAHCSLRRRKAGDRGVRTAITLF